MNQQTYNILDKVVAAHGRTSASAHQFFVSWNSVITVAYVGFTRTLVDMKKDVAQAIPDLKPENPGAKWPKTTLGCLEEKMQLTDQQVRDLRDICARHTDLLQCLPDVERTMSIGDLNIVTFECRTLERRQNEHRIQLTGEIRFDDSPTPDERKRVEGTMAQFDLVQHDEYIKGTSKNSPNMTRIIVEIAEHFSCMLDVCLHS